MTPVLWTVTGLAAFAAVLGAVTFGGSPKAFAAAVKHVVGSRGWVEADPRELARAAGASPDVYALASMMQSEAGDNQGLQIAVGWCAVNKADQQGVSLLTLLTRAGRNDERGRLVKHDSHGFFGPQNVGPRYASTRKMPTVATLQLAQQVADDDIGDPTDGCTQFDAPSTQDKLLAAGVDAYTKSSAQIALERSKGAELVMLPGITSTRFWRPREDA